MGKLTESYSFEYEVYQSIEELSTEDAYLVTQARKATELAYAPYSNFNVGAYANLSNGSFITGSNQENASYPVGICAERALLAVAGQLSPIQPIVSMGISYHHVGFESNIPLSPCGMCRQALQEYESRVNAPIRLLLSGMEGKVWVIKESGMLLPFSFKGDNLK